MANEKILAKKQEIIDEIKSKVQENSTIVLFDYRGITDNEAKELRRIFGASKGNILMSSDFSQQEPLFGAL